MNLAKKILACACFLCCILVFGEPDNKASKSGRLNLRTSNKLAKLEKGKVSDKLVSTEFRRERRERKEKKEDEKLPSTSPALGISAKSKSTEKQAAKRIQKRKKENFQVIQNF